jgi:hypothetical protein
MVGIAGNPFKILYKYYKNPNIAKANHHNRQCAYSEKLSIVGSGRLCVKLKVIE